MIWNENNHLSQLLQALQQFSQSQPQLSGWIIEARHSSGRQALLAGISNNSLTPYQDRDVNELSFSLELYCKAADPNQMGIAKGSIDPGFDLQAQFEILFSNAQLTLNTVFKLPGKPDADYPSVESADSELVNNLDAVHLQLLQRADQHSQTLDNVIVNSAELFCNRHDHIYISSTGIRTEQTTTDLYFEVAMEKAPKPNTQEVFKYWHCVGLADATIEAFLDAAAFEAQLTEAATLPPTKTSAQILIDDYAISKLVAAITAQLNGSAEYSQGPHLKAGDFVNNSTPDAHSDQLTLTLDPSRPLMAKTTAYSSDGQIAQRAELVTNNVVKTQIIDARLGQYLGKPANHITGNMVVEAGSLSKQELLTQFDDVIELLDLSSLLVNPVSMTWSSEIKLGLYHRAGQPTQVLKGGIVSGNVKDNLAGFKFSADTSTRNTSGGYFEAASGYVGPKHMLIWQGVTIAGQEEVA